MRQIFQSKCTFKNVPISGTIFQRDFFSHIRPHLGHANAERNAVRLNSVYYPTYSVSCFILPLPALFDSLLLTSMLTYLVRGYDFCLPNYKRFILNRLQYRIIPSNSFSTTYDYERGRQG